jgi:hypothetical protein
VTRTSFAVRGGDLVHLVSLVCLVCLVQRTREARQTHAPDRLPLNRPPLTQRSHNPAVVVRFTTQSWTGRPLEIRISLFFYPTKEIMSHQSIVSNLFGRHLCPFASGF